MVINRSSHSVWECRYHVVWVTWRRRRALNRIEVRDFCKQELRRIADEYEVEVESCEGDIDHVHVFLSIPPQLSVGKSIGVLKSVSARFLLKRFAELREVFWSGRVWGSSYFVRSVGDGVTADMVRQYIENHENKSKLNTAQAELFTK